MVYSSHLSVGMNRDPTLRCHIVRLKQETGSRKQEVGNRKVVQDAPACVMIYKIKKIGLTVYKIHVGFLKLL